jgi:hypothetical protein
MEFTGFHAVPTFCGLAVRSSIGYYPRCWCCKASRARVPGGHKNRNPRTGVYLEIGEFELTEAQFAFSVEARGRSATLVEMAGLSPPVTPRLSHRTAAFTGLCAQVRLFNRFLSPGVLMTSFPYGFGGWPIGFGFTIRAPALPETARRKRSIYCVPVFQDGTKSRIPVMLSPSLSQAIRQRIARQ